jgi:hypothetical protein
VVAINAGCFIELQNFQSHSWIIANRLEQKTLHATTDCFGIWINPNIFVIFSIVVDQFILIIVYSLRGFSLEAMNSSRSCPAGSNLRPFKSQAGAFDEFPMSLSKQSTLIDKGNGVGYSISFYKLIPGAVS